MTIHLLTAMIKMKSCAEVQICGQDLICWQVNQLKSDVRIDVFLLKTV